MKLQQSMISIVFPFHTTNKAKSKLDFNRIFFSFIPITKLKTTTSIKKKKSCSKERWLHFLFQIIVMCKPASASSSSTRTRSKEKFFFRYHFWLSTINYFSLEFWLLQKTHQPKALQITISFSCLAYANQTYSCQENIILGSGNSWGKLTEKYTRRVLHTCRDLEKEDTSNRERDLV